jgi:small subunit ribosomal protein S20
MRQAEKKRLRNQSYRSQVKTAVKKYLKAVEEKAPEATALFNDVTKLLHRGAAKGVYHKNTAGRTVSRLARRNIAPAASATAA